MLTFRNSAVVYSGMLLSVSRTGAAKRPVIFTEDIQDALKDLLGGTLKEMLEAEMDDHLGYE